MLVSPYWTAIEQKRPGMIERSKVESGKEGKKYNKSFSAASEVAPHALGACRKCTAFAVKRSVCSVRRQPGEPPQRPPAATATELLPERDYIGSMRPSSSLLDIFVLLLFGLIDLCRDSKLRYYHLGKGLGSEQVTSKSGKNMLMLLLRSWRNSH